MNADPSIPTANTDPQEAPAATVAVLFVCMGNICRSPMAHGVFWTLVHEAGLSDRVIIDSAGTLDYHAGQAPDARAQRAASRRGYDLSELRARALQPGDCLRYDLILAMDRGNYNRVRATCEGSRADVRLFMELARGRAEQEVPDPYGGGEEGFDYVMDLIEAGAAGLLEEVRARLGENA